MKKILLLLVVCFSLIGRESLAFRMMGLNFNKSIHGGYREFTVHNDTMRRERYKITLTPGEETDITEYLEVYPKVLTIEPQSYKVFKIFGTAKPEDKLEKREYKFNIDFTSIVVPTIKKYEGSTISGTATMGFAPSIEMRTYAGTIDYEKDLNVTNLTFSKSSEGNILKAEIENKSQGTLELGLALLDDKGNLLVSKSLGNVKSQTIKVVEISFDKGIDPKKIVEMEFYDDNGETIIKKKLK